MPSKSNVRRLPPAQPRRGRPPLPTLSPHVDGLCADPWCPDCQDVRTVLALPAAALVEFTRRRAA
jgi:hypothetical protein